MGSQVLRTTAEAHNFSVSGPCIPPLLVTSDLAVAVAQVSISTDIKTVLQCKTLHLYTTILVRLLDKSTRVCLY